MLKRMKDRIERVFERVSRRTMLESSRESCFLKIEQVLLYHRYREIASTGSLIPLDVCGYRVFSQSDEDGILLAIFAAIGMGGRVFVDIGAADGISSNCSNLAVNWGWYGLFLDGDSDSIDRGRRYYASHPDTRLYPPRFVHAHITAENANDLIRANGISNPVDLLSVDIDGNDYWVWSALECIDPRVVVIEATVEFGRRSIVVPYDANRVYPGIHPDYRGASPTALVKLAHKKGYRLVAANRYGFNLFFVKCNEGRNVLPDLPVEAVLMHPRIAERASLFKAIENFTYIEV